MKFKKIVSLMLVGIMLVMTLSACSDSKKSQDESTVNTDSNSKEGTNSDSESASNGEESTDSDASGNSSSGYIEINAGTNATWTTMTPFRSNIGNNAPFAIIAYETLACFDESMVTKPLVAKEWETTDGGYTFDVEIYDYVKDSAGNHITAADVVWMIEESITAAQKPSFKKIESIEQTGDYTFRIKMKSNIIGAFELVLRDTFVVSKKAFEESPDAFATNIVTTSQYVMTNFVTDSVLSFEKRSDYWQTDETLIPKRMVANVDKINYYIIQEASQLGIALETGDIDIALTIDPNTGKQFEDNPDYTIQLSPMVYGYQMFFSGADNSVLANDKNLRQAICYAIDEQGMVDGALAGYGTTMNDVASDILDGYQDKWHDEDYYTYDIEKAKELLAQSNYNGEELIILTTSSSTFQRIAQMIQAYLSQIGVKVKLNIVDRALYTASRLDGTQYDMVLNHVAGNILAELWSIRFDSAAYKTGDATSRRDPVMDQLLYDTWTIDGWTAENINKVHDYLKENMYAYGMVQPMVMDIVSKDANMTKLAYTYTGAVEPTACEYKPK